MPDERGEASLARGGVGEPPLDRIGPTERPHDRPAGFQRWRTLCFLHWPVAIDAVRAVLPPGLSVDSYEGRAWVGVVPFTMRDVVPFWAPSVPGVSNFHELNVRTYVHFEGKNPGVFFLSLDAASSVAVLAARAGWSLPYFRARMSLAVEGPAAPADPTGALVRYSSRRLWPGPKPAELELVYRVGAPVGTAPPGTFEHFLAERYILYAMRGGRLQIGRVHHRPYPLQRAEVLELDQSMVRAAGLPEPEGAPHALFSPGVDVDVFALRAVS